MIESVNTVPVQSSAALKAMPQSSASYSVAANVSAAANFISSRIRVDNLLDMAILEVRSSDTGDVVRQFPTEYQIRAFQQADREATMTQETARAVAADNAAAPPTSAAVNVTVSAPVSQPQTVQTSPVAPTAAAAPQGTSGGTSVVV